MSCRCENCGKSARVQILAGYSRGIPVLRFFCLDCARGADANAAGGAAGRWRLSNSALLLLAGVCVGALVLPGDPLGIGASVGFGIGQKLSVAAGAVMVVTGALLRADLLGAIGTVIFSLGVAADLLGWAESSHVATWRGIALGLSLVLIAGGMSLRRRSAYLQRG